MTTTGELSAVDGSDLAKRIVGHVACFIGIGTDEKFGMLAQRLHDMTIGRKPTRAEYLQGKCLSLGLPINEAQAKECIALIDANTLPPIEFHQPEFRLT